MSLHLTVEHHTSASSPDESGCCEAGSFTKHNGYYKDGSPAFIVTSKPQRDAYFAYKVEEAQLKKLGKAKNPVDLYTKFIKEGFR